MRPDGMTILESCYGPTETGDRLIAAVSAQGMTLMARIDHAAGAAKVGFELPPTEVFLFGNPRAGTPAMQAAQTIGIDLPLKALVWQDAAGRTWLGYNQPDWILARHGVAGHGAAAMQTALAAVAAVATGAKP